MARRQGLGFRVFHLLEVSMIRILRYCAYIDIGKGKPGRPPLGYKEYMG